MKVVFVVNKMDIGGPQKIVAFLANRMVADGHEVTVVTYNKKSNLFLDKKVELFSMDYDASVQNEKNPFLKRLYQIPLLLKIRKTIRLQKPDILCVFTVSVLRMVEAAVMGCRYPIISSERGNPYVYSKHFFKNAQKAYRKCEMVIFQTEEALKHLKLSNGVVIPNPAVMREKRFERHSTGIKNLLLAVGRLEQEKGFDFLIDCVSEVAKEMECHLRIYGSGSMENRLQEMVKKKGLDDAVELCGESNCVFSLNSDASAYILSSYTEGMPNTLIEAMIAGIPCIATDCTSGGPRFLLDNGNRGILIRVGDKEQMVKAIKNILKEKEKAKKIAEKALCISEELAPEKIYCKWIEVFEETFFRAEK